MANPSTLYRFRIELSDIDRSVYESLDFRVAMHPSETEPFLLTRVLAYVLNYEEGLVFSGGISSADEPAISLPSPDGRIRHWIEIGSPAARRLHKAAKAAGSVSVYTYKDPENLKKELAGESIHRAAEIRVFAIDPKFLDRLATRLVRDNRWVLLQQDGEITLNIDTETFHTSLVQHHLE